MGPIKLRPSYLHKMWGGDALNRLFHKAIPDVKTGESWEVSTHPDGMSQIQQEDNRYITLDEFVKSEGEKLLGKKVFHQFKGDFPLLIKLIDARDKLSVQVHPNESVAKKFGVHAKTEAWVVIEAKPDAKLIYGLAAHCTKEDFVEAIQKGTLHDCLAEISVKAGDVVFIPAGLVHAIGEGVVLFEVQQNTNTTYRVYDYNRLDNGKPRKLHVKEAIESIDFMGKMPPAPLLGETKKVEGGAITTYIHCPYFALEKLEVQGNMEQIGDGERFYIYTAIKGQGHVKFVGGDVAFTAGESILIPATLKKIIISGQATLLKTYIPDENETIWYS